MKVIGVVDLLGGKAVHARGGSRALYRPVRDVAGVAIDEGDARALVREYHALGVREVYVADLDAILQGRPQDTMVAALTGCGIPLWLDGGVTSAMRARQVLDLGISRVVVGLETLTSFAALAAICEMAGAGSTAFSLDVKDGAPLARAGLEVRDHAPDDVAARAAGAGATAIIVLDLSRVGSGSGFDLSLIERIRRTVPAVTLLAGGGVRGPEDLARLADAGCDGALVGTALLAGRLTVPADR
jgi:phosphoribosylformimino-5-aminoimidazole carboxamide ribotide isomerase